MANSKKHMERSHYSHNNKEQVFGQFEQKANLKKATKEQKKTFVGIAKSLFHRTTNK